VQIALKVLELVVNQLDYCKKYNIIVTNKGAGNEYAKQKDYLAGVNMKILLIVWYK